MNYLRVYTVGLEKITKSLAECEQFRVEISVKNFLLIFSVGLLEEQSVKICKEFLVVLLRRQLMMRVKN